MGPEDFIAGIAGVAGMLAVVDARAEPTGVTVVAGAPHAAAAPAARTKEDAMNVRIDRFPIGMTGR